MPNWIVHLGLEYPAIKLVPARHRDILVFLLAAVLPDLSPMCNILLLDVLQIESISVAAIWYVQPFHTPFMMVWCGAACSFLIAGPYWRYFVSFVCGAWLHFFLDMFQSQIGFYQLVGYPFTFADLTFGLFPPNHAVFPVLTWVSLVLLLAALLVDREKTAIALPRPFRRDGLWPGVVLLAGMFLFPVATKEGFFRSNFHYLNLFSGRESFEGKPVELCISRVESTQPLVIHEMNRYFTLDYRGAEMPKKGEFVSLRGVLNGDTVTVTELETFRAYGFKKIASVAGSLLLLLIVLDQLLGVLPWRARGPGKT